MKNKIDLFLEIADDFGRASDEKIEMILNDSEYREIHSIISKTACAIIPSPEVDIDREWQRFCSNNFDKKRPGAFARLSAFYTRNAAAIVVWAVAGLAVVAATIGVRNYLADEWQEPIVKPGFVRVNPLATADTADATEVPVPENIVFKNQPLATIISAIAEYYGATVQFENADCGDLRLYFQWSRSQSLEEVVEQLDNFEQVNISLADQTIIVAK